MPCNNVSRWGFIYRIIICICAQNLGNVEKAKTSFFLWLFEPLPAHDFPRCQCFQIAGSHADPLIVRTLKTRFFFFFFLGGSRGHMNLLLAVVLVQTWRQVYFFIFLFFTPSPLPLSLGAGGQCNSEAEQSEYLIWCRWSPKVVAASLGNIW